MNDWISQGYKGTRRKPGGNRKWWVVVGVLWMAVLGMLGALLSMTPKNTGTLSPAPSSSPAEIPTFQDWPTGYGDYRRPSSPAKTTCLPRARVAAFDSPDPSATPSDSLSPSASPSDSPSASPIPSPDPSVTSPGASPRSRTPSSAAPKPRLVVPGFTC